MSEWIKLYSAVFTHPKTRRVAKWLSIPPAAAVGHLAALWAFTAEFAPDGDLSRFDAEEVELGAGWEGQDGAFIAAALAAGYLEEDSPGLIVHDWEEYGGKIVQARAVDRKRKAVQRASSGCPADVQRMSEPSRAGEREKREEKELKPPLPPQPVDNVDGVVAADSQETETRPPPDVPVSVCGPVSRIVGKKAVNDLLTDGSDLNTAVARYLAEVDALTDQALAEQSDERRAEARVRCRRTAFDRIAATHAVKPIANLPAYLTTARQRATVLGDLVGDDLVRELRAVRRSKGDGKGDPKHIADLHVPDPGDFPLEVTP